MIQQIFTTLSRGVEASPPIALTAALVWGILSIILSPCHLASIPLIIGFIDNHPNMSTRRAFTISLLFAFGILISIALIGAITALAGRMLGDIGSYGNYFVALIFILVGLNLLGVFPIPFAAPAKLASKRKGTFAAFMLGLIFGIALGPCTFAYMAPIIAVTFKLASTNLPYGILLLLMYGLGHCSVIVMAGTSAQLVQQYMNWNEKSHATTLIKRICAILIIIAALYMIYKAP